MHDEITIKHNNISVTASYLVIGDTLTVYLPDGSIRETQLRGLNCESAAKLQLRAYLKTHKKI